MKKLNVLLLTSFLLVSPLVYSGSKTPYAGNQQSPTNTNPSSNKSNNSNLIKPADSQNNRDSGKPIPIQNPYKSIKGTADDKK